MPTPSNASQQATPSTSKVLSAAAQAAPATVKKVQTAQPKTKPATSKHVLQAASKSAPVKAAAKPVKPTPAKPELTRLQAVKTKPVKEKKVKVVRDSFTIPKTEFTQIAEMKKRAMTLGVEIKKSELIRAGLQIIANLPDASFKKALAAIPTVKTGRPSTT
jgi:hypothetical protein